MKAELFDHAAGLWPVGSCEQFKVTDKEVQIFLAVIKVL